MSTSIRVLLVDDQELIRTGFALILGTEPDLEVVGEASDGAAALRLIADLEGDGRGPDVVLMDVRMAGMNGIEATGRIVADHPGVRVLVLTTFDLDEYAMDAIEAGASGFLLKDARAAELIGAVRAVADGDSVLAPSVTRRLLMRLRGEADPPGVSTASTTGLPVASTGSATGSAGSATGVPAPEPVEGSEALEALTEREREVFELVAEGLSNAEIGDRLFLSESTVKTHVGRVFAKLELRDRVHAVIRAYELGLR